MYENELMYDEYLAHFGVKGMKWGVRRTPEQLGNRVSKLSSKNERLATNADKYTNKAKQYHEKSVKADKHNAKYEKRLSKATAKKAKYDVKLTRALSKRNPNADKVAKYTAKTAKYQHRINKAQRKIKYNKWAVKSEEMNLAASKAKDKIAKNEKLMNTYQNTIKALDSGKIEQGRLFMQYALE